MIYTCSVSDLITLALYGAEGMPKIYSEDSRRWWRQGISYIRAETTTLWPRRDDAIHCPLKNQMQFHSGHVGLRHLESRKFFNESIVQQEECFTVGATIFYIWCYNLMVSISTPMMLPPPGQTLLGTLVCYLSTVGNHPIANRSRPAAGICCPRQQRVGCTRPSCSRASALYTRWKSAAGTSASSARCSIRWMTVNSEGYSLIAPSVLMRSHGVLRGMRRLGPRSGTWAGGH